MCRAGCVSLLLCVLGAFVRFGGVHSSPTPLCVCHKGYPGGYPAAAPTYTPNLYQTGSPGYPPGKALEHSAHPTWFELNCEPQQPTIY